MRSRQQTSNDTNNTSVRTTFGRRSDIVGIAAEDSNDESNNNTAAADNKHVASSSTSTTTEQPFTSPLGNRIWSQYCTSSKTLKMHHPNVTNIKIQD